MGSGLSSSAAVEVATCLALADLSGHSIDRTTIAKLCQKAENEFAGAHCGIMDQYTSCYGKAGNALLLDCDNLEHQYVPIPSSVKLAVANTMVKHELSGGEYNLRRAECEEAVSRLKIALPEVHSLRDVTARDLDQYRYLLSDVLYRRCHHVVYENQRVLDMADALLKAELSRISELMAASHRSLRDDYEVSCKELDLMVEIANRQPGILGTRMMGGGFGGCTISMISMEDAERFRAAVASEYRSETSIDPGIYICETSDGARKLAGTP
jgi:galactokinase